MSNIYKTDTARSISATIQYLLNAVRSLLSSAGTVTSVSVTTANGVSGTVATATTTPAITLALGAITPTSVNSVVISGASTPTLAVTGTTAVSGTNTGDQTNISGNASTVTTNANLTGPITSVGNATSVASQTGTGSTFVMQNTPTLTTPDIGAATGTSLSTTGPINTEYTTTVAISSADILSGFTVDKTIVAAPGAGNFIEVKSIMLILDYASAYTIGASTSIQFRYVDLNGLTISSSTFTSGFLDNTVDKVTQVSLNMLTSDASGILNQPVIFHIGGANPTGGTSTISVRIVYRIIASGL